jgi:hypothetical protein
MAYYMFLKSLRSQEDFRKNPHIKIPPKSPCINFQSLAIFKNPIFVPKRNSLQILAQPTWPPNRPVWPTRPTRPLLPPSAPKQGNAPNIGFRRLPALPQPHPPRSYYPELHTASADHFPLLPSSFRGLNTP